MVETCGLVRQKTGRISPDGTETVLDEAEFQRHIDKAMANYADSGGNKSIFQPLIIGWRWIKGAFWSKLTEPFEPDRTVKIEFLGLWDTVAALGFPQFPCFDRLANRIRRHKFYNLSPHDTVNYVYHAVAVDDERRTFWPLIWDEPAFSGKHIEQVWFPGVHSNVGGGYPREGLADVTLRWMIERIRGHQTTHAATGRGLDLDQDFVDEIDSAANPFGKLYDSRAGFALFYRFQPRRIARLCSGDKLNRGPADIRIHSSVFQRMGLRTAGYAPGHLPNEFREVDTAPDPTEPLSSAAKPATTLFDEGWGCIRSKINKITGWRIGLYWSFLCAAITLLIASLIFWLGQFEYGGTGEAWRDAHWAHGVSGWVADILSYVLPALFRNIIDYGFLVNPWAGAAVIVGITLYYILRWEFRLWSDAAQESARLLLLSQLRK